MLTTKFISLMSTGRVEERVCTLSVIGNVGSIRQLQLDTPFIRKVVDVCRVDDGHVDAAIVVVFDMLEADNIPAEEA
jgi:hypothetical protein